MKLFNSAPLYCFLFLMLFGCAGKVDRTDHNSTIQQASLNKTEKQPKGSIMLLVRIKSELPEEELIKIANERAPQFRALPGLIQKYYTKTQIPGEYIGVYVWESMESIQNYRESELAATIAEAYNLTEPPTMEMVDIMFELRDI